MLFKGSAFAAFSAQPLPASGLKREIPRLTMVDKNQIEISYQL